MGFKLKLQAQMKNYVQNAKTKDIPLDYHAVILNYDYLNIFYNRPFKNRN